MASDCIIDCVNINGWILKIEMFNDSVNSNVIYYSGIWFAIDNG